MRTKLRCGGGRAPRRWRGAAVLGWLLAAGVVRADSGAVKVERHDFPVELRAYAQVEPVAVLPVRAALTGTVSGLAVVPGTEVKPGQILAALTGAEIAGAEVEREAAVIAARSRLAAAELSLASQRRQLAEHLSTPSSVADAEAVVAGARAAVDAATAQERMTREQAAIRAPAGGIVLALNAADGERVAPGQAVVTVQPAGRLWLHADFYGADVRVVRVGMEGRFTPDGAAASIPVRVAAAGAVLGPDGGESVGLAATGASPGWAAGEFGTLVLDGPTRSLVAVPTRALILDQGRWWVLVRTAQGVRPQAVEPGPARGWLTYLERGLEPGAEVVVENAYLEFHRGIAANYQPPD